MLSMVQRFLSPIGVRSSVAMPVVRNASFRYLIWTAFSMFMFTVVSVAS